MSSVDMRVRLGSLELRNPVLTASGTFGSGREYADFFDLARLGAVVTKGVSLESWSGNPGPRIVETPSGMLNSIGLQNPGVEAFCAKDLRWLADRDVPVIVNVVGHRADEYAAVAERLEQESGVHALEVNISCPNVDAGGMAFGTTCPAAAEVVRSVRAVSTKTLIVKLSPNVTDVTEVARAVEAEGADAVSLINTLLGMVIDTRTFKPVLARGVGGLSGPAVRPVAVRMVWQVSQAVSVPVIGMGGITCAEDATEFMLAGASCVAVGTANFMDPTTAIGVVSGLERFSEEHGVERITDLVGAAWKTK
ncbi:MAG: dihydroorotate dehydrogenase [Coriobacteriia bacterium]|nr:dihydroorotate dehydrogenase [Coriobacteriia bacterium]